MNRYEIRCTQKQAKKALRLGAPIRKAVYMADIENGFMYLIPTAEQMIGFLRSKGFKFYFGDDSGYWRVSIDDDSWDGASGFCENKELAAIDAALDYLTKK